LRESHPEREREREKSASRDVRISKRKEGRVS
jgi:hypothetical protein